MMIKIMNKVKNKLVVVIKEKLVQEVDNYQEDKNKELLLPELLLKTLKYYC